MYIAQDNQTILYNQPMYSKKFSMHRKIELQSGNGDYIHRSESQRDPINYSLPNTKNIYSG